MSSQTELSRLSVGDAMHHGIFMCAPQASLQSVAQTMAERGVHCVAVYADPERHFDGELWGIVSSLDLVGATRADTAEPTAGEMAATSVVTTTPDETLERAAQLMHDYAIAHLVVTDPESGRPIGILSTLDVARMIASPPAEAARRGDGSG